MQRPSDARPLTTAPTASTALSTVAVGVPMQVVEVRADVRAPEWAGRLRELGFIAGEPVRVLRRGQPGGEPLAVRVGVSTFALRRAEADCVLVQPVDGAAA
ncbi:MAG: FeoA family protein [Methyloversatilis sp.]|jgi:ferrous iron transport protein A|nr:FeoA family protein [Methyloversatilis sp.]